MSVLAAIYTNTMHEHFRPLYANWQPGAPIALGDYGTIKENFFYRLGNILEDYDVNFLVLEDTSKDHYEYSSSSETELSFTIGADGKVGEVADAKAGIDIRFAKPNSVYFNAAGCRIKTIRSIKKVGDQLIALYQDKRWNSAFAVVTTTVEAEATTIIVSGESNASLQLEAKANGVKEINLADANLDLRIKNQKNVAFKVVTTKGMTPLFGLMQIKVNSPLFGLGKTTLEITTREAFTGEEDTGEEEEEELIFTSVEG